MRENQQNLLMTIYALIGKIGIDEPKALGLDTSMVVVERVPLIINHCNRSIRRITQIVEEDVAEDVAGKEKIERKKRKKECFYLNFCE